MCGGIGSSRLRESFVSEQFDIQWPVSAHTYGYTTSILLSIFRETPVIPTLNWASREGTKEAGGVC